MTLKNRILMTVCAGLAAGCAPTFGARPLSDHERSVLIARGHQIAEQRCSSCHAMDNQQSEMPGAPPLRAVLRTRDDAALIGSLVGGHSITHANMPAFRLSPSDADALIEYIDFINP